MQVAKAQVTKRLVYLDAPPGQLWEAGWHLQEEEEPGPDLMDLKCALLPQPHHAKRGMEVPVEATRTSRA